MVPAGKIILILYTMYSYINGSIVESSKAMVHVSDLAIQRGYGVFDFFKVVNGHSFFLDDYLNRFYRSAEEMRLTVPLEKQSLVHVIASLIARNAAPQSGIKMILTGGYSADGYQPSTPNLYITEHPLMLPESSQVQEGIAVMLHEYVREFPHVKSINYAMGIRLMDVLKANHASDALYHQNGIISEFPRCNFFIVRHDNTVVTPAENVLNGITRAKVLQVAAKQHGAIEGEVTIADALAAKEAFLTSTTKRILPVVRIDGHQIGDGRPGKVTLSLLQELLLLEQEDVRSVETSTSAG